MDNVGIVFDDPKAAIAFFVELGMELEGEMRVEGRWADRVVGLDDVQVDVAMMRTPDGHARLELIEFDGATAVSAQPKIAPANTLGIRRIMLAVEDIENVVARLRALMASNSLVSWCRTRTNIGSVNSAALRA
jgi:catechol 2,3-dioxygenase-like lactoylglutathione lyase family enzyme